MAQRMAAGTDPETADDVSWVELVLYLTDIRHLDPKKLHRWSGLFHKISVAAPVIRPGSVPGTIRWHMYSKGDGRSEIWDRFLSDAGGEWVLFLEDDEEVRVHDMPDRAAIGPGRWAPSLILQTEEGGGCQTSYQMRLVPKSAGTSGRPLFDGKDIPDCTRTITGNNIRLSRQVIRIDRKSSPFRGVDPANELSVPNVSPGFYLEEGRTLFKAGKYVQAAAQYRRLLKMDHLLPFDRLAGVNGLAACLTEQFRWPQALKLTEQSIGAESRQRMPYLIQFRIYQLNKQWKEAYRALKSYHEVLPGMSMASFDQAIAAGESLYLMADSAFQAGVKEEALSCFEQFIAGGREKPDRPLLRRLLFLSIELSDYDKAVFYFEQLFEPFTTAAGVSEKSGPQAGERPGSPTRADVADGDEGGTAGKRDAELEEVELREVELNDAMAAFISRGWVEYASEVYGRLYQNDPGNDGYRRRLIVSLTKANRLDSARKVISGLQ